MTRHDPLTRALADLDAADRFLDEPQRDRAAATLDAILVTDPAPVSAEPEPRARRRRTSRWVLAGGALAAASTVVAAVVVGPALTGSDEAFASWSATPVGLVGGERTAAGAACAVLQAGDGELATAPGAVPDVLVAEARGGWTYVVYTVDGESTARLQGSCLMPDELVDDPRPGRGGFFGGLGGADEVALPAPPRDVARQDGYGVGSVDGELFAYAEGRSGAAVAAVEVTTPGGQQVTASVDDGYWAAWWPVGDDSPTNPETTGAPSYEVTLRDSTGGEASTSR